jgi:hypothetical protein
MSSKQDCIRQIEGAKNAIVGIEAAYVARTRLRRLILACSRMIAREYHITEPILPSHLTPPPGANERTARIADCCNRLLNRARILSQPSEPLDDRWKSNWALVLNDLELLRDLIASGAA